MIIKGDEISIQNKDQAIKNIKNVGSIMSNFDMKYTLLSYIHYRCEALYMRHGSEAAKMIDMRWDKFEKALHIDPENSLATENYIKSFLVKFEIFDLVRRGDKS